MIKCLRFFEFTEGTHSPFDAVLSSSELQNTPPAFSPWMPGFFLPLQWQKSTDILTHLTS
ncbi:hypothetical protein D515_03044 [Grimontia indica]|uniref:Uncharacterized protein n=1 Tax=Grimontia indica TaxID=1056512 RepID=R1IL93_9GAMM|nr:hypothetical protein D515_03044 [Grimontia indica]